MEIPGLYAPESKLLVSRFFSSRSTEEAKPQQLGVWRTWTGTECARFIADVCQLAEYGDVAERNLTGAYIDELLQAGLLSKGLAKIGIGDFEHVRQITAAIQKLDFGARLGVSLGSSTQGKSLWMSSKEPPKKPIKEAAPIRSTSSLPKLRMCKPKPRLLDQVFDGYAASLPEYKRRLASPARSVRLPKLKKSNTLPLPPNACPVEATVNFKPVSYVFDGCHSPTVTDLRKAIIDRAASEGAIRAPYWTSGRNSPEPWGGQNEGVPDLVKTGDEWHSLRPATATPAFAKLEDGEIAIAD